MWYAWLILGCWMLCPPLGQASDILLLLSHDDSPYRLAQQGFQDRLVAFGVQAEYRVEVLRGAGFSEVLGQRLQDHPPDLVLALGTPASQAFLAREKRIPLVAALVLDIEELKHSANATGVGLSFPADVQWAWLRRMLPEARSVGAFFAPRGVPLFNALRGRAHAEGVELHPALVEKPQDLPAVLRTLPQQMDALWILHAAPVFNDTAERELLLYSFRNRVPLIGLSAQWVKAGALYAPAWDYADLGAQAAELAHAILRQGKAPADLPPLSPRKGWLVVNAATAEQLKFTLSQERCPTCEVLR